MNVTYGWRQGFHFPVPAEGAAEELERIRKKHGNLTRENILKESKAKRAYLHHCYEWDDAIAAHEHRLETAGRIRRGIMEYIEMEPNTEPHETRLYNYIEKERTEEEPDKVHLWAPVSELLATEEGRRQLLQRALRELNGYKKKYSMLKELAAVMEAIDEVNGELV